MSSTHGFASNKRQSSLSLRAGDERNILIPKRTRTESTRRNYTPPSAQPTEDVDEQLLLLPNHHDIDLRQIFLTLPVTPQEIEELKPAIEKKLLEALDKIAVKGYLKSQRDCQEQEETRRKVQKVQQKRHAEESLTHSKIDGDARDYQTVYFEICKRCNAIVHLGTGRGKTLIAILLIEHFAADFQKGKQTIFVVPTNALANQQSSVLRANLPAAYTVTTANADTLKTESFRGDMAQSNVLVGTHGSLLELFTHHKDLFHFDNVNLLVLDECHHATGESDYVRLMKLYHDRPVAKRPRILGLTASPLINVKKDMTDEALERKIGELEQTLDARIISPNELGINTDLLRKQATVEITRFSESDIVFDDIPLYESSQVHADRHAELNQIIELYNEVGPYITDIYVRSVIEVMKRNQFNNETQAQFQKAEAYLSRVSEHCRQLCSKESVAGGGRSDKVLALEELLEKEIQNGSGAVGIVFIAKRVTAIALNAYFSVRLSVTKKQDLWPQARDLRRLTNVRPSDEDVFMDADESEDPYRVVIANELHRSRDREQLTTALKHPTTVDTTVHSDECRLIKTGVLIRKTGLSMHPSLKESIKSTLHKFKQGGINVVFATSIAEEGVDVRACSFVAVFDPISSIKSFVQMKGRARQENAKLYAFVNPDTLKKTLSLIEMQEAEDRVSDYLSKRQPINGSSAVLREMQVTTDLSPEEAELRAVECGYYRTCHGHLDMGQAKSLMNRYVMSAPMDTAVRQSRESLMAYMPLYDESAITLHLPSHLSAVPQRQVVLPDMYRDRSKSDRQKILAMMACVRLHRFGLLTDRLLPFSSASIRSKIMGLSTKPVIKDIHQKAIGIAHSTLINGMDDAQATETQQIYVYRMICYSEAFESYRRILGGQHIHLALLCTEPHLGIPSFALAHRSFGKVSCSLANENIVTCRRDELEIVSKFFSTIMNARWTRKKSGKTFRFALKQTMPLLPEYWVACVDQDGFLNFDYMEKTVAMAKRSEKERMQAVIYSSLQAGLSLPRLWSPLYNPHVTYISYGNSGKLCNAPFEHEALKDIATYQDYFRVRYECSLSPQCPLFDAQHLWDLPSTSNPGEESTEIGAKSATQLPQRKFKMIDGLSSVLLPVDAMTEAPMADPGLLLVTTFLPQFLYRLERYWTAQAFRCYCMTNLPTLGLILSKLDNEEVMMVLTAKSCNESKDYEILEWFGDAVLKLVQTDVIIKSTELKHWINNLHEGFLSQTRSALGCNKRLLKVAKSLGIDRFIMTSALSRGKWSPSPLELYSETDGVSRRYAVDGKTCADLVEALLGLVFSKEGYEISLKVSEELGLTIEWEETDETISDDDHNVSTQQSLSASAYSAMQRFTGYKFRPDSKLLKEALTHPTMIDPDTSSYQRLEWIGDAVVCLCVREYLFRRFGTSACVGQMVELENALVSNETLALLAFKSNIHAHLRHNDPSLPHRLRQYAYAVTTLKSGVLWGTNPPKVMADLTESILGAVHMEGGYAAAQTAAVTVLEPVLDLLINSDRSSIILRHPKKLLHEKCGTLLSLRAVKNADEDSSTPQASSSAAAATAVTNHTSTTAGAVASCLDTDIVSLSDTTSASAMNRIACILLSILDQQNNPQLCARLAEIQKKVHREVNRKKKRDAKVLKSKGSL